jgi:copper chaperone CopZ
MNKSTNSEHWFHIQGNHCGGCKKKIERVLGGLEAVKDVDMNIQNNRLRVTGDLSPDAVISVLGKIGFSGLPIGSGVRDS